VRGRAAAQAARPRKGAAKKRATRAPRRVPASALPAHAAEVRSRLQRLYPDAHCELDHRNAWELLVATILSAQCTDRRVNMVTPHLFAAYPAPAALAKAKREDVEEIIRSTGFFRSKAKSVIGMAGAITDHHRGQVPRTMAELVTLPGVGRKTANVVLGNAYGVDEGIVVDTHVARLSQRLGLTKHTDPSKIEQDLMRLFPRQGWTMLPHLLITHGRRICEAKKPRCEACALADICPSARR
jgi:endonuclease-3